MNEKPSVAAGGRSAFLSGMKDGIPIGLGYLAVSFSLGIAAKRAGLTPWQGFFVSLLCNASAGEYAGFRVIAACAPYIEMALATFVANARYILMSCALSQRAHPDLSLFHRMLIAFGITDELFGIAIARPGYLTPAYSYGALAVASPCWALGTMLGVIAGNLLPLRLVSALSVALYGMFIACFIPPAKKDRVLLFAIPVCFLLSYLAFRLPYIGELSEGTRAVILTVVIASVLAIAFPVKDEEEEVQP